jgi:transcriptional antiterminator RfaH
MTTSQPNWYVVHTQPHGEAKASVHLERQGFEVYLPRILKRRSHARKIEKVSAPLFHRYLFVAIDLASQRWRCVNSTQGVSRLVCWGDAPAPVAKDIIEHLRSREDEGGFIKLETRPKFAAGDKITVLDGVFAACFGIYEGMADRERVTILLNLLGRKVRVSLGVESVAAA